MGVLLRIHVLKFIFTKCEYVETTLLVRMPKSAVFDVLKVHAHTSRFVYVMNSFLTYKRWVFQMSLSDLSHWVDLNGCIHVQTIS